MFHALLDSAILQNNLFLNFGGSGAVFHLEPWKWLPLIFCASRCLQSDFVVELIGYISIFIHP